MSTPTDALVVGGGLAGAALATRLASAGRNVLVLEREPGPHHKVCGEFLSYEAGLYLGALGLDLAGLGAVPIEAVELTSGARRAATARLPFHAQSLSRRVLDEALLVRAEAAGARVRRGARVKALARQGDGWAAELETGETVAGRQAFLANGKHDLRGWRRPAGAQPDLVGFKLHWRLRPQQTQALARRVHLCLFPGGYAGFEPVEAGLANLCLLVRRKSLDAHGGRWDLLLAAIRTACPALDARLQGAEPCWDRPLAIAGLPYGYVRRTGDGPWRLGDQAAVIPSFAGDGMSIALHSAHLAAEHYLAGSDVHACQRQLCQDVAGPVARATWLSQALVRPLGQALLSRVAEAAPWSMTLAASLTRIRRSALDRRLTGS